MPLVLVALTDLDPLVVDRLLDSLAAVFPVLRRRGWPGIWFVEVEQSAGPGVATDACDRVGQALDDLRIEWRGHVTIVKARELDSLGQG
jgi:hypothetical protein